MIIPTPVFKKIHNRRIIGLVFHRSKSALVLEKKIRSRDLLKLNQSSGNLFTLILNVVSTYYKNLSTKFHSELDEFDLKTTQTPFPPLPICMSISKEREPFHGFLEL